MLFRNRADAGRRLAAPLKNFAGQDVVVLALPRGGVPVGFEVAQALGAPLDVFLVRKLRTPGQEELAMGAIASGGVRVLNQEVVQMLGISPQQIDAVAAKEARQLRRREHQYRGQRERVDVQGRTGILVDDGLATGSTMRAAVVARRLQKPEKVVVAVPVAARSSCAELRDEADTIVCLYAPLEFEAVGQWYLDFSQTTDKEVRDLLARTAVLTVRPAA